MATVSGPPYLETLIDGKFHGRTIVEILGAKLDFLTSALRNSIPSAKEGLSDILKFIFNLLLHYPKVCGVILDIFYQHH